MERRNKSIQDATKNAIMVPFSIMEISAASLEVIKMMAEIGNPNSVTDAGVGALCARTAVIGAFLNVKINCKDYKDKSFVDNILKLAQDIVDSSVKSEKEILEIVESKI